MGNNILLGKDRQRTAYACAHAQFSDPVSDSAPLVINIEHALLVDAAFSDISNPSNPHWLLFRAKTIIQYGKERGSVGKWDLWMF